MFQLFKSYIESHFGVVLILGVVSGLFLPGADQLPSIWVPYLLASIIFFGCAKITLEDLKAIRIKDISGFYIFRFLFLPFVIFYLAGFLLPDFRFALLLMALLPCGVTLPAVTGILGGNAGLGLSAAVLTSFFAPLTIPLAFSLVSDMSISLDVIGMGKTLAMIIFLPALFYFLVFRRWAKGSKFVREYSSFAAVVQISIVATIIIASQRAYIMENIGFMVLATVVTSIMYASLYALGWWVFRKSAYKERVSYTLMSGNLNIALGVSLAFLYFPAQEISILVGGEVGWLLVLSLVQLWLSKKAQD